MNKVVIVGCGNVGMAYAYALVNQKTYVDELVLIDINVEKTIGEVMDLNGLSVKIDVEKTEAKLEHGVLKINAPKKYTDKDSRKKLAIK